VSEPDAAAALHQRTQHWSPTDRSLQQRRARSGQIALPRVEHDRRLRDRSNARAAK
jgi:hypothetical protein